MAKQVKLISVENLRSLNPKKDGGFLMILRQSLVLALEAERGCEKTEESEMKGKNP